MMIEHHAVVCVADSLENSVVPEVYKTQSSDVSHIVCDRFSIDDARQLSQVALQKPVNDAYRVFVLVTKKLPVESQNALLKLFEEPPTATKFFLIIPNEGMLISTLRSRVQIALGDALETNEFFLSFLKDCYADRLKTIADITKRKDVASTEALLSGAEVYVAEDSLNRQELLKGIVFIQGYAKTPGASAKMLLEELALCLPTA